MKEWATIKERMTDAGCSAAAIERAESLCQGDRAEELIRCADPRYEKHVKENEG